MNNKKIYRVLSYVLGDIIGIVVSFLITIFLLHFLGIKISLREFFVVLPVILTVQIFTFVIFGTYKLINRYIGFGAMALLTFLIIGTNFILGFLNVIDIVHFIPSVAFVVVSTIEIIILIGYRITVRYLMIFNETAIKRHVTGKRTLILGAGSAGELVLREMLYNKSFNNFVVGFLDDDHTKVGRRIINKDVLGTITDLDLYINRFAIEEIVIAINNVERSKEVELINVINSHPHIKAKRINVLTDYNERDVLKIVDVNVEDLLEREPISLETKDLLGFIKDEVVLVTGGGGSIGSELSRQIFNLKPKKLIIFDIYENNAYDIQVELERLKYKNPNLKTELVTLIGSVYNEKRVEEIFNEHRPTLVFHAAAYKHVPLMEDSAREAIRTNVIGTKTISEKANKYKVKKMVLVSSDKAVRPTNVMGATKRYAELIVNNANNIGPTKFSAVRFGNVLGSKGSVIPLFKKQIEDGGPVTVTHKDIERYFMTIPESVGLILQSGIYADGGEIFVLDMGNPVKIYDLAEKMIKLAGFVPHKEIEIEITGLRPGEKLFEELLIENASDNLFETDHSRIFIEKNHKKELHELDFEYVLNNFEDVSNEDVKTMLSRIITSYQKQGDQNA